MVHDETTRFSFYQYFSFFAITFDTASHETIVLVSFLQELPEAFGTTIVLFNHFVWETLCLLISNKDLFRLEASQFLDTFIDIARDQVLVASMKLGISFFNECYPKLVRVFAVTENWLVLVFAFFSMNGNTLVNDDIDPLKVLEKSYNVQTDCTIFMENWWVDTL